MNNVASNVSPRNLNLIDVYDLWVKRVESLKTP